VRPWKKRSSRIVYRNEFVEAHEDTHRTRRGGTVTTLRLVSPPFACVVAVTRAGEIVFVRNYRPTLGTWLLELPGGRLEPGERAEDAARRELEEETGYRARSLTQLGWFYPSPARLTARGVLFLATELARGRRRPDPTEEVETVRLPIESAYRRLRRGQIHCASAMIGLALAEPALRGRSKVLIPRVAGPSRSGVG
jgi:ADP-ribose pyrophosphatase